MERTIFRALLLASLSGTFGKYVYVEDSESWTKAQEYCRLKYTDLAPISSKRDDRRLLRLASPSFDYAWMGLYRDPTDKSVWRWSGGGKASYFAWASDQPENRLKEDYGVISAGGWHDATIEPYSIPFFCYRVIVVRERRTWEGAMQHCRRHHRVLASLASETEMLLVQKEMREAPTTELLWAGLRYLGDRWLWVDGERLKYKAWQEGEGPQCPVVEHRCGALRLDAHGVGETEGSTYYTAGEERDDMVEPDSTEKPGVWEARNCSERLHFLCY